MRTELETENLREIIYYLGVDGGIILKRAVKYGIKVWTRFI